MRDNNNTVIIKVIQPSTRGTVGSHIWLVHFVDQQVVGCYRVLDNGWKPLKPESTLDILWWQQQNRFACQAGDGLVPAASLCSSLSRIWVCSPWFGSISWDDKLIGRVRASHYGNRRCLGHVLWLSVFSPCLIWTPNRQQTTGYRTWDCKW